MSRFRIPHSWHCYALAYALLFNLWGAYGMDSVSALPDAEPGVVTLTAHELAARLRRDASLLVIDVRIGKTRKKGYIEGSTHLPDVNTACDSLSAIAPDKKTPIAFYCNSPQCGRSLDALRIARGCGFSNIFWFRGGFEEWKSSGFPYRLDEAS